MKGIKNNKQLFRLGSRGIAHFLAPLVIVLLVGVIGTYMVVASHADAKTTKTSTSKKAKVVKHGYLVIYNESGKYNAVKITATNLTHNVNCMGATLTPQANSVVKLMSKSRLKSACTPIGTNSSYNISYDQAGNQSKFDKGYVAVDVDGKGFCTLVYPDASKISKVAASKTGGCATQADPITKSNVAMRVLPTISKSKSAKKTILGYVEVTTPGASVTKAECTGQVDVTFAKAGGTSKVYSNPLKYTKPKKGAKYTNAYCVATFSKDGLDVAGFESPGSTFTISANFAGNAYFNPMSAVGANVTIPKS